MSSRLEIYFMTKMIQFSKLQIKFLTLRYKDFEEQIIKTHDKLFLNCIGFFSLMHSCLHYKAMKYVIVVYKFDLNFLFNNHVDSALKGVNSTR